MRLFIAGQTFYGGGSGPVSTANKGGSFECSEDLTPRVNCLESFYYIAPWQIERIHRFKDFMLDSGGFTFCYSKTGGKKPSMSEIDEYAKRYMTFVAEHDISKYVELDLDPIIGYEGVLELRKRIERFTGRKTIPVWHVERGKQAFFDMCSEYEYVAIGGIVVPKARSQIEPYLPYLVREAHKRGAKVHGLGYTNIKKALRAGFDSVDSTTWLSGNRSGAVFRFDGNRMHTIRKDGTRLNAKAAARNNFIEWLKYAEYLEREAVKID